MRFRLVDSIVDYAPWQTISAVKAVSFEEYSLKKDMGEQPGLPETLLVEAMLQAGNWLIILSSNFQQLGLVVGIKNIEIKRSLNPGETACFKLKVVSKHEDSVMLEGQGSVGDEVIIIGQACMAVLADLEDYEDPDDLKVIYEEIGPEPFRY